MREGKDLVVHAPTGAGKTYIFELLYPSLRGQAVFTVPTRALANDKLSEWRARGWDVGISTGDIAERLDARVIVATLETQKGKFLQRLGPRLLVIDEYQMIGDAVRGVNYELALALAPENTQLLLLSGSVANPTAIVDWLRRIGRDAVLVTHSERPVPLEEVDLYTLPSRGGIRAEWPRLIANALRADLGPVLLFAPRRNAAEALAQQLASSLPPDEPLALNSEQQLIAGPRLSKLLSARVAYHHSGLSYAQRAGLIEPLAKNGQLRVVVATMGLAAGINFSMRSVAITGTSFKAGNFERQVQPDELLQMFGRAGRRGLDDCGYALVSDKTPRLFDARPRVLRRASPVDWPTLIAVMRGACERGTDPFQAANELNRRLFTPIEIPLGVEHSRATGPMPCGLSVDFERARFLRRGALEMLNSRGIWEPRPPAQQIAPLGQALVLENGRWRSALSLARTLNGNGPGSLCKLDSPGKKRYGRELPVGRRNGDGQFALASWLRPFFQTSRIDSERLKHELVPRLPEFFALAAQKGAKAARIPPPPNLAALIPHGDQLVARFAFDQQPVSVWRDSHGQFLLDPPEQRDLPLPCRLCPEQQWCNTIEITPSPAFDWRRLGLIDPEGCPTRRGIIFSFFHHGEGLAIAAALEESTYPIDELIYDLANLRAGARFAGDDSPYGGRLGALCQTRFDRADLPGYLEMGVPVAYGAGASEIVREMIEHQRPRQQLLTESLRQGDLERAIVEWRSLLRHIIWAPAYDWDRWKELKAAAAHHVEATVSPTLTPFPPLTAAQQRRR